MGVPLTTVKAMRSSARRGMLSGAGVLAAMVLLTAAAHAQTRGVTDEQRRQEIFKDGAEGAGQRSQSLSATTNRQQQLLGYQLRKAKRFNRQNTCRSNGLPKDC
jgi:hypothetical protein